MKKIMLIPILFFCFGMPLQAQKYFTRSGNIHFYSDAALEKIEAVNNNATAVLDAGSGKMEFAVLIKAFQFEKALMQEHFNENYMESSKYPKAKFKGQIKNNESVDYTKEGTYDVSVEGELSMHGKSNPINSKGQIIVKNGQVSATSTFEVAVADYGIEIPAIVRDNIAKIVKISVRIDQFQILNQ